MIPLPTATRPFFGFFFGLALVAALVGWGVEWNARRDLAARVGQLQRLNDSTTVLLAESRRPKPGAFPALDTVATITGGTLVGGVKLRIKTDTLYLPIQDVPTDTAGETRTATVRDTTDGYTVAIDVAAPPASAPLQVGYRITTPERTPEIGFLQQDGGVVAVVSGRGITATRAFFAPPTERRLSLWAIGGISSGVIPSAVPGATLRGEGQLALQARVSGSLVVRATAGLDLGATIPMVRPYIGLEVAKRLW